MSIHPACALSWLMIWGRPHSVAEERRRRRYNERNLGSSPRAVDTGRQPAVRVLAVSASETDVVQEGTYSSRDRAGRSRCRVWVRAHKRTRCFARSGASPLPSPRPRSGCACPRRGCGCCVRARPSWRRLRPGRRPPRRNCWPKAASPRLHWPQSLWAKRPARPVDNGDSSNYIVATGL